MASPEPVKWVTGSESLAAQCDIMASRSRLFWTDNCCSESITVACKKMRSRVCLKEGRVCLLWLVPLGYSSQASVRL